MGLERTARMVIMRREVLDCRSAAGCRVGGSTVSLRLLNSFLGEVLQFSYACMGRAQRPKSAHASIVALGQM